MLITQSPYPLQQEVTVASTEQRSENDLQSTWVPVAKFRESVEVYQHVPTDQRRSQCVSREPIPVSVNEATCETLDSDLHMGLIAPRSNAAANEPEFGEQIARWTKPCC